MQNRYLHEKKSKVWKWAGDARPSDKNIGGNWEKLGTELHQLLDNVEYWIEHKTYPSDEIAYCFHHRLVLIHFFPDGNDRPARLITDILLIELLKSEPFTGQWRRFPIHASPQNLYRSPANSRQT